MRPRTRAQSNLVALAIAILLVSAAIVLAVTVAGTAFDRGAEVERHIATGVTTTLLAPGSPVTRESARLNRSALNDFDERTLRQLTNIPDGMGVRVTFAEEPIVNTGNINDGVTVRRLVTVSRWDWVRSTPDFGNDSATTLRPAPRVRLGFNTTVETVRVNGRVVLHDPRGLDGPVTITVSGTESISVRVMSPNSLSAGDVWIAVPRVTTTTGVLRVTVDD